MVQKITVTQVDDLDGTEDGVTTIPFGIDGVSYEIDLSDVNAAKLREVLAPFIEHGRRTGGSLKRGTKPASGDVLGVKRAKNTAIREWARAHGFDVGERGRISQEIRMAFAAAHASTARTGTDA